MFITTHTAMGALVGELFPTHPILAFFVSMLVHFTVDAIPHGDTDLYKGFISGSKVKRAIAFVAIDGIVALIFGISLLYWHDLGPQDSVVFGIAGGVLPDLLVAIYEVTRVRGLKWFHRLHFFFHNVISGRTGDFSLPIGLTMELTLLAVLVFKLI